MTYDFLSRHLKSQTIKTPKPSLLTTTTIDNTPNYLTKYNHPYLADTHY